MTTETGREMSDSDALKYLPVFYQLDQDVQLGNGLERVYFRIQKDGLYRRNLTGSTVVEVTCVFKDEKLRKWAILDDAYRLVRRLLHRRTKDIETFFMLMDDALITKCLSFPVIQTNKKDIPGAYSASYTIVDGSRHCTGSPTRFHVLDEAHPRIFVNTENHAMGEKDNNPRLWKREFLPSTKGLFKDTGSDSSRCFAEKITARADIVPNDVRGDPYRQTAA